MNSDNEKLVIVDTDPGVDDAMALLFLKNVPKVSLHSITTVFGNSDVETTSRNACYLVERFDLRVGVYAGASKPLERERFVPELKVHGDDGFGDTGVAKGFAGYLNQRTAADHIIHSVLKHPGQISILALAPLTNLAEALRKEPKISGLIKEVIVMGGAFGGHGRFGNITPTAEANIYYDPEAAAEVFAADLPLTVVGLDVTSDCILSATDSVRLSQQAGDIGKFLWQISRDYEEIYRVHDGIDGCCIHDVAAAACLVNEDWFEMRPSIVSVDLTPNRLGQTTVSRKSLGSRTRICTQVKADELVSCYVEVIKLSASGTRTIKAVSRY